MPTISPTPRLSATSLLLATVIAAVAWPALGLQYWLLIWSGGVLGMTIAFLSFFTIVSNIAVALVCTFVATGGELPFLRWWRRPHVLGAVALYIAVTGLIYAVLLRGLYHPQGPQLWADVALHDVVPVLYLVWWIGFTPHGALRWVDAGRWLIVPAIYAAWTIGRGVIVGTYPYPFIDVIELGYPRAILNGIGVGIFFYALGLGLIAIDRLLGRRSSTV
ncbi:hypothetical protein EC912_10358 [Luteibacter rhizovicinus]|uniref:FAR-17a/AIG1-like protein n=1 Tax=Luteibacter rhizovicinus TaxID=242606 RepID=A0A4R3YTC3_9GAMM|nr:Pr6Pr family membrane protein [Luteibacter rhizovicinus]TCV94574.1 hypothetical protein EC912_10358 [Luteibacter rhizovicinus]